MKVLDESTKFAHLGKPGSAFTKGFQRRFDMVVKREDLKDKKILDMGTGEGVWLGEFVKFTAPENVFASEYDEEQVKKIRNSNSEIRKLGIPEANIVNCPGERLDFPDNFFDIIFHNEVLEHVQDDERVLSECLRVLKPGGKLIFFTPNRGWPFEQHGMFFRGKYYWGNIPLLPWMPKFIFKKFAPHVRNYWWRELRGKIQESGGKSQESGVKSEEVRAKRQAGKNEAGEEGVSKLPVTNYKVPQTTNHKLQTINFKPKIIYHTRIFPGFDKMERKFGILGKFLKNFIHFLEKTPLKFFGISHFVIVQKMLD